MINCIYSLLGKNKTQASERAEKEEKPIQRRYYKLKVESYYGLCGIKMIYGEADLISVPNGFSVEDTYGCDAFRLSRESRLSLYAFIPKGAEFVSEDEYLRGKSK